MQSNKTALADIIVPFAEAASVKARDAANTLKKRIIVSLGFIDTAELHDKLFPGAHIEWPSVLTYTQSVRLPVEAWCELIGLLQFVREAKQSTEVTELVASAMAGLQISTQGKQLTPIDSLRVAFARAGMAPCWDILAKSLLLCNLIDVDHSEALAHFLGTSLENGTVNVANLMNRITSIRHSQREYTDAFFALLSNDGCHVESHRILASLKAREEAISQMHQHQMRLPDKPCLTDIVEQRAALAAGASRTDPNQGFAGFCLAARMQGNAAVRMRRACYYVMALPGGAEDSAAQTHAAALRRIVGDDAIVLDALATIKAVTAPDTATLRVFINEAQHTGPPPPCLSAFRKAVVAPAGLGDSVTWTTVLRLYLAAYSRPVRELWLAALASPDHFCHLPTETEKIIRNFVTNTPLALADILPSLIDD